MVLTHCFLPSTNQFEHTTSVSRLVYAHDQQQHSAIFSTWGASGTSLPVPRSRYLPLGGLRNFAVWLHIYFCAVILTRWLFFYHTAVFSWVLSLLAAKQSLDCICSAALSSLPYFHLFCRRTLRLGHRLLLPRSLRSLIAVFGAPFRAWWRSADKLWFVIEYC